MLEDEKLEAEILGKGLTAPRVTPDRIDGAILGKQFYVFPGICLTVCCLTLKNGFTVTGKSACVSPENYDQEISEDIAYKNAREKIWVLEGYLLAQRIADGKQTNAVNRVE